MLMTAEKAKIGFIGTGVMGKSMAFNLMKKGYQVSVRHAANSAALLRDSRAWFDFVRPGLLLYGLVPPPLGSTIALRPVMSLTSQVVAVKGVRVGETVGYGGRFTADRPVTLAVIPAGYADGLDRRLENHGSVLIRGRRAKIVGAVSMDMLTADATDIDGVARGSAARCAWVTRDELLTQ